jgi:arsenate reductase
MKCKVLFLCTGNSCRSQMAEGFLRSLAADQFEAYSAGINPVGLNPNAVLVMKERGIDISGQKSKNVTSYLGQHFPFIITVCDNARAQCPIFPGPAQRLHWGFEDPAHATGNEEARLAVFRRVRDEIEDHIRRFLDEHRQQSSSNLRTMHRQG